MKVAVTPPKLDQIYDTATEIDVMIAMRDGVRLASDVHRPAHEGVFASGAFPVLVERTPYGKNNETVRERTAHDPRPMRREEVAAYFVRHGYVVVIQDLRGRDRSEGRFTKYLGEAQDGYDTLAWIAKQPWCNGRIGTYGLSYAAHTQTALASARPPGLSA
ncbi:MAG TPA: CocE/NonD family hydrolase, partial [Burkholderiales bacterium]